MAPILPGSAAPPIPGAELASGPSAVLFYKVTCPTCQISAPVAERLHGAFPERFVAVAQDPQERIDEFAEEFGTTFASVPDTAPFQLSNSYGIRVVPTLFVVEDGTVADVVEAWDREGWNRLGARLSGTLGHAVAPLSEEGDGLPPYRPG